MDLILNIELKKRDNIKDNQTINWSVERWLFSPVLGPQLANLKFNRLSQRLQRLYGNKPLLPPACSSVRIPGEVGIGEPTLVTQALNPKFFDSEFFPLLERCYPEVARTPPLIFLLIKFVRPCLNLPGQSSGSENEVDQAFHCLYDFQLAQTYAVYRCHFQPIIAPRHNEP